MKYMFKHIIGFSFLMFLLASKPLMIQQKEEFFEKMKTQNIAVIYYGDNDSQQFQIFQDSIPTTDHLYQGIQFVFVPSNKFKLNRPNPSISIYRKIGSGDWIFYGGNFQKQEIKKWIKQSIFEQLEQLKIQQLDRIFKEHVKSFIVVDYGEFELIRTKIYLQDFCKQQNIACFKIGSKNPLLSVVLKLLAINPQDHGISRLTYYNPNTDTLELYTKDLWFISKEQLLQLYQGRKGIVPSSNNAYYVELQEYNDNL